MTSQGPPAPPTCRRYSVPCEEPIRHEPNHGWGAGGTKRRSDNALRSTTIIPYKAGLTGKEASGNTVLVSLRVEQRRQTYASSVSAAMSAYAKLPGHHLRSTLDLLASTLASTYTDSAEDSDSWAGADFSGLCDPEALRRFLATRDYRFGYSDSDEGSYDPSRECFHIEIEVAEGGDAAVGRGDYTPPQQALLAEHPRNQATMSAPEGHQRAELGQLQDLEAKLKEDRQQLQQLQTTLEREQTGRGDGGVARLRARDVQRRINEDQRGEQPPFLARASQNIAAAAILLWSMPEPPTSEGRRVHDELRGLLECAVVQ